MADKVILVVSFGTSYNNNRDLTIGAIENDIKADGLTFEFEPVELKNEVSETTIKIPDRLNLPGIFYALI